MDHFYLVLKEDVEVTIRKLLMTGYWKVILVRK
jgi:hypothetical protein